MCEQQSTSGEAASALVMLWGGWQVRPFPPEELATWEVPRGPWRTVVRIAYRVPGGPAPEVALTLQACRSHRGHSRWRLRDNWSSRRYSLVVAEWPEEVALRQVRHLIDATPHPFWPGRGLVVAAWRQVPADGPNPVEIEAPQFPALVAEYHRRWQRWCAVDAGIPEHGLAASGLPC